jgi:hypothetical protein
VEKKLLKNPVRVDSKKRLAKSDETGDEVNRIWRELVKLHAVDKEKPTKKLVGRKSVTSQVFKNSNSACMHFIMAFELKF